MITTFITCDLHVHKRGGMKACTYYKKYVKQYKSTFPSRRDGEAYLSGKTKHNYLILDYKKDIKQFKLQNKQQYKRKPNMMDVI